MFVPPDTNGVGGNEPLFVVEEEIANDSLLREFIEKDTLRRVTSRAGSWPQATALLYTKPLRNCVHSQLSLESVSPIQISSMLTLNLRITQYVGWYPRIRREV